MSDDVGDDQVAFLSCRANEQIHQWLSAMECCDFHRAGTIAVEFIREHRDRKLANPTQGYTQFLYGTRIVLNGLRDISNLCIVTQRPDWIEYPGAIEEAWVLAHDAMDRIDGYTGLDAELKSYCAGFVQPVLDSIHGRYGKGVYTSWEMILDGLTCTICGTDIRGCEHIPGEWYASRECRVHPEGGTPSHIALVKNPVDPRCRIWPWLRKGTGPAGELIYDVPIYIIFNPEGQDDGGGVIDPASLYSVTKVPGTRMIGTLAFTDDAVQVTIARRDKNGLDSAERP
jgi:hypothetical protein